MSTTEPLSSASAAGGGGGGDVETGTVGNTLGSNTLVDGTTTTTGGGGGGGANIPPEPEQRGALKPIAETTPKERIAGIFAGGAVGTALAAIIIEQSIIVIVAGVLSIIVGPYAYWQQTRLTDIAALKETHEAVQEEVNRLASENVRLESSIQELSNSVERLEDIEEALKTITKTQGQSINTFEQQVKQNRNILSKMKQNHKTSVLQNLLSVILRSDLDGDSVMDDNEIDDIIKRMEGIAGVEIDDDKFRALVTGKSIMAVMDVIKNLLKSDIPEEERIFHFVE